jgi:hypothetical protein
MSKLREDTFGWPVSVCVNTETWHWLMWKLGHNLPAGAEPRKLAPVVRDMLVDLMKKDGAYHAYRRSPEGSEQVARRLAVAGSLGERARDYHTPPRTRPSDR